MARRTRFGNDPRPANGHAAVQQDEQQEVEQDGDGAVRGPTSALTSFLRVPPIALHVESSVDGLRRSKASALVTPNRTLKPSRRSNKRPSKRKSTVLSSQSAKRSDSPKPNRTLTISTSPSRRPRGRPSPSRPRPDGARSAKASQPMTRDLRRPKPPAAPSNGRLVTSTLAASAAASSP